MSGRLCQRNGQGGKISTQAMVPFIHCRAKGMDRVGRFQPKQWYHSFIVPRVEREGGREAYIYVLIQVAASVAVSIAVLRAVMSVGVGVGAYACACACACACTILLHSTTKQS